LGYQFTPRLRDIGAQTLYRINGVEIPSQVRKLMKKKLHPEYFLSQWDDLLRLAGSLKHGWVTASLLWHAGSAGCLCGGRPVVFALTPLFYEHINPYGLFELDLERPSFLKKAA